MRRGCIERTLSKSMSKQEALEKDVDRKAQVASRIEEGEFVGIDE